MLNMAQSKIEINTLRFEHLREPLGIGAARPRLSWTMLPAETSVSSWR